MLVAHVILPPSICSIDELCLHWYSKRTRKMLPNLVWLRVPSQQWVHHIQACKVALSNSPPICLSICPLHLSTRPSMNLSVYVSLCLSVRLSAQLIIYPLVLGPWAQKDIIYIITYGPHKAVAEVSNRSKSEIQLVRKSMDFTFSCFVLN